MGHRDHRFIQLLESQNVLISKKNIGKFNDKHFQMEVHYADRKSY